jgi:hypothetical protein
VDLGDGVMGSALRAKPVRARVKLRFEDRLQHQLEGRLRGAVPRGGDAEPASFGAAWLGDHPFPHGHRGEPPRFEIISQLGEEPVFNIDDGIWSDAVDSGCPLPPVPPHPPPRHYQDGGVAHEVEQVIEPATRIIDRPLVQLGLDPQYLRLGRLDLWPQHARVHRRSPAIPAPSLRTRCRPWPCDRLSRPPTTTAAPPRPGPTSRARTCPPPTWTAGQRDEPGTLPTFTVSRSTGEVPNFAPATSPRVRRRLSSWPPYRRLHPAQKSPALGGRASHPGPYPPDWSRCIS